MRGLFWSASAIADPERITTYIALDNPVAADRALARIEASAENLANIATGRRGRIAGTYEKPVSRLPYVLAYMIQRRTDGREDIVILHVIHMKRDWREGRGPR